MKRVYKQNHRVCTVTKKRTFTFIYVASSSIFYRCVSHSFQLIENWLGKFYHEIFFGFLLFCSLFAHDKRWNWHNIFVREISSFFCWNMQNFVIKIYQIFFIKNANFVIPGKVMQIKISTVIFHYFKIKHNRLTTQGLMNVILRLLSASVKKTNVSFLMLIKINLIMLINYFL